MRRPRTTTIRLLIACAALSSAATFLFVHRAPSKGSAKASSSYDLSLSKIVSTAGQEGLQYVSGGYRGEGDGREYVELGGDFVDRIGGAQDSGASNVFLVDAVDFSEAANASSSVFLGGRGTSQPVPINALNAKTGSYWLVAYLGIAQSSPTNWIIEGVTAATRRVRLTYSRPKIGPVTADVHRYFYWASLGFLSSGAYHLELYDADLKAVTLMRRVAVPEATSK